jgi:hypothetical protein
VSGEACNRVLAVVTRHACFIMFHLQEYTVGALADSYYEYLLKVWLLGGKADESQWRMFAEAAAAIERDLVRQTAGGVWCVYAMLSSTVEVLQFASSPFVQVYQRVK